MSFFSDDIETSKFPRTSRFFSQTTLPDFRTFQLIKNNKPVSFNGQHTNINYNPYTYSQLKTKANLPFDYHHLPNKIHLTDLPKESSIPEYNLDDIQADDPILFFETVEDTAREHGAIKVRLPESKDALFRSNIQINSDLFWFQSNKLLNNSPRNELENRLRFHQDLVKFHNLQRGASPLEERKEKEGASQNDVEADKTIDTDIMDTEHDIEVKQEDIKAPIPTSAKINTLLNTPPLEEGEKGPTSESPLPKLKKIPTFLHKLPMIDKRPLDLYKFFRSVIIRGGFVEVINKKLWAQIGRELGYKGKIMTSLSSSLKSAYQRILYPFELHLGDAKYDAVGVKMEETKEDDLNANGKREFQEDEELEDPSGRCKDKFPLIIGSSQDFRRSIKSKSSKGILLNSPYLIDVKPLNTFVVRENEDDTKKRKKTTETITTPILPQTQIQHVLNNMDDNQMLLQDNAVTKSNARFASIYSLRQFMDKDLKFQEFVVQNHGEYFNKMSVSVPSFYHFNEQNMPVPERNFIRYEKYEELFWKFAGNENVHGILKDGLELESGEGIPNLINGSGFVKLGDDFINYKNNLVNLNNNSSASKIINAVNNKVINTFTNSTTASIQSDISQFNTNDYISRMMQASLDPWNLNNLPILPNSILGAFTESDLNNQDLVNSRLNIGMSFSSSNWRCEDHFTQLINYQFFGACKRWYFIPELDFHKFEQLLVEINTTVKDRVHTNNCEWNVEELLPYLNEEGAHDALMNSLENMINPASDIRLPHTNPHFQGLIESKNKTIKFNQDFLISPALLKEKGIRFTTTLQKPGEYVVKSPKTFSCSISFGLNLSEEVNFTTQNWLNYAFEGEQWLAKQGIIPNFLTLKLLVNLIQLYDSGKHIGFNSEVYAKVGQLYDEFYKKELTKRNLVRKLKIKEVMIDEKLVNEADLVSDDDLVNTFPSKIVLIDPKTKQKFIITLENFLKYYEEKTIPFDKLTVELHLVYSDDKLKNFAKILGNYSIDYEKWMSNYEDLVYNNDLSLKAYRNLLSDGERIYSAISSSKFINDNEKLQSLKKFKFYIENLRIFITDSNQYIEECQNLLAIKHQQRIRNGNDYQRTNGLADLVRLIERIPSLNFSCTEIDQIIEFKTEIENFDKATRLLLSKKNKSLQEFNDLINLGESFGIAIPSLTFMTRIRDKMKWTETFRLIEKGADPYGDKKEVFSIDDLKRFFQQGLDILSCKDVQLIKTMEAIVNDSEGFNREISAFLNIEFVEDLDFQKLTEIIDRFRLGKLFLSSENYEELSALHANSSIIVTFNKFKTTGEKFPYADIRQLHNSITESGLKFNIPIIADELLKAEKWVQSLWDAVGEYKLITTLSKDIDLDHLNAKLTLNSKLVEKLYQHLYKTEFSYSDKDLYVNSSSYSANFKSEGEQESECPQFYCICREYEFGTMIECDTCNEWYHIQCVNEKEDDHAKEEDSYLCPICKLVDSDNVRDEYLTGQLTLAEANKLLQEGQGLKVFPSNELDVLKELCETTTEYSTKYHRHIEQLNVNNQSTEAKVDTLRFILRKVYASGLLATDLLENVLSTLRSYDKDLKDQLLAEALTAALEDGLGEINDLENGQSTVIDTINGSVDTLNEPKHISSEDTIMRDSPNVINGHHAVSGGTESSKILNGHESSEDGLNKAHGSAFNEPHSTINNKAGKTLEAITSKRSNSASLPIESAEPITRKEEYMIPVPLKVSDQNGNPEKHEQEKIPEEELGKVMGMKAEAAMETETSVNGEDSKSQPQETERSLTTQEHLLETQDHAQKLSQKVPQNNKHDLSQPLSIAPEPLKKPSQPSMDVTPSTEPKEASMEPPQPHRTPEKPLTQSLHDQPVKHVVPSNGIELDNMIDPMLQDVSHTT